MMDPLPSGAGAIHGSPAAGRAGGSEESKIEDAARQFEALMVAQLMKSMRDAGAPGWLGTGEDPAGETALELAEEQFARALAAQGGLGLARMVMEGLRRASAIQKTAEAQTGTPASAPPSRLR